MKEMIYSGNGITELLAIEWFNDGTAYAVVNTHGSHPCAYIQFPGVEKIASYDDVHLDYDEADDFWIHGGFTYLGTFENLGLPGIWLGWDYAHCGDWTQSYPIAEDRFSHEYEKKWTTEEVVDHAKKALDYIRQGKYEICSEEG